VSVAAPGESVAPVAALVVSVAAPLGPVRSVAAPLSPVAGPLRSVAPLVAVVVVSTAPAEVLVGVGSSAKALGQEAAKSALNRPRTATPARAVTRTRGASLGGMAT
jgi:hypothetical protein